MSRINIEIPDEQHQKLKIIAAINSISIKDFVLEAVKEKIEMQISKKPNPKTMQAFKETDTGIGLVKFDNLSDLLINLGLENSDNIN